ncbi:FAD-binding oxidoreductase [Gryllotalpicola protaetiae]|uniref:FAD-binding oxidoreductase n=1 Tax=Gryllotalpicola protaetiae TaxID=2419771 RepID=UPI0013C3F6C8|nr:FAD-binding protein [Gryllotalpicola protaetiae]
MSGATAALLAARTVGPVWDRSADDRAGYDAGRSGFNLALDHRPDLVLAAQVPSDVAAGIRFAAEQGLTVELQATGHGAHRAMDGGLLITTRALTEVSVDPARRVARISAGATSADVLAATAPHGLTAPVGSAATVGYVSYSLGGGLGMLGRAHGYAADRIRALQVVTADGRELSVSSEHHPELFWGLRGGGGKLAAVTAIDVELIPLSELYGGGLFFDGVRGVELIEAFRSCIVTAPRELSLSIAFLRFPRVPTVPETLRGRYCGHVRVAYLGEAARGARLIAGLRALPTLLDTVRTMPVTDLASVHADPRNPMPVCTDSVALRGERALDRLPALLDPDAPFVLELRHLGGALVDQPAHPNAVGHRAAELNLFTSAYPGTDRGGAAAAQRRVTGALAELSVGGPLRNFLPSGAADASACYEPGLAVELARLATRWDPSDVFAFAPAL